MKLFIGFLLVLVAGLGLGTLVPSDSLPWIEYEINPLYSDLSDWSIYENEDFSIDLPPGFQVMSEGEITLVEGPQLAKLEIYSGIDIDDNPIKVVPEGTDLEVYDAEVPKGEIFYIDGDGYRLRFWHRTGDLENEQLLFRLMSTFNDKNDILFNER